MEDEILQEETTTEQEQGQQTQTQSEDEPVIYTGPNIIAFALTKYQVFQEGLPPYVKRAIEKIPEIAELIVPVSKLEAMKQKITRPGTNEARLYYTVQEEAKKYNAEYRRFIGRRRR